MIKIDGWLFAQHIFHAYLFICNNADSSSSKSTTTSPSTSTNTSAPTTPNSTEETTALSTTAETTITTSSTTYTPMTPALSPIEQTIIGIGSIVVVAVVVFVTVCCYRRKKQSNSGTNTSMNNAGLYEIHMEVFGQDNYDQIVRITSGRENNMLERVYNNEEPEYLTIEE